MSTAIGKKLRSRKVQLACEFRQNQYADTYEQENQKKEMLIPVNDPNFSNLQTLEEHKQEESDMGLQIQNKSKYIELKNVSKKSSGKGSTFQTIYSPDSKRDDEPIIKNNNYDTVTSFHDIEQDDQKFYNKDAVSKFQAPKKYFKFDRSPLGKINETEKPTQKNAKSAQQ